MTTKEKKPAKFQFVFLNVEGDNETIQEGLRQAGIVVSKGLNNSARTLVALQPQALPANVGVQPNVQPNLFEVIDENTGEGEFEEVQNTAKNPKPKTPKKAPPTPSILKDFDPNESEISFFDFVSLKDTSNQIKKYLIIAAWFKKYKDIHEISVDHIYTCFQLMSWEAPNDMPQLFRSIKSENSTFDNGSKKGMWAINIVGLNEVDKMKPKNTSGIAE